MKKKKRKDDLVIKKSININFLKNKLSSKRNIIFICLIGIIFSLVMSYTGPDNNVGQRYCGDATHYYKISTMISKNVFPSFFSVITGVIFNRFSKQDYQRMGFLESEVTSIYRTPAVVFLFGFLFFLFSVSPHTVLISNSIIFGFDLFLVFTITMMLFNNKKISYLFTFIYFFYIPFHLLNTFLLTENIVNPTLLLLIFFYIKSMQTNKTIFYFFTGIFVYLIMLMKTNFQYLGFLLIVLIIYQVLKIQKGISIQLKKKIIKWFLIGFLIIFLPWKFITYRASGDFNIMTTGVTHVNKINSDRVFMQTLDTSIIGLEDNTGNRPHTKYFREFIDKGNPRYKNNIWFYYSSVCGPAWKKNLKENSLKIIMQSVNKAFLLLVTPMIKPRCPILTPFKGLYNYILHNLIIFFGLFSVFLIDKNYNIKLMFIFIILYHFIVHGITVLEHRYNVTTISSFLFLAGYSIVWLQNNLRTLLKTFLKEKKLKYILILIIIFFILFLSIEQNIIKILAVNFVFILISLLIFFINKNFLKKINAVLSSILLFLFLSILYNSIIFLYNDFDKYYISITKKNNLTVKQIIKLPDSLDLKNYDDALLAIDMKSKHNNNYKLAVKLNQKLINKFDNGLPIQTNILYYLTKTTFNPYDNKWVFIKFNKNLLKNINKLEICVEAEFDKKSSGKLLIAYDKKDQFPYYTGGSFFRNFKNYFIRCVSLFSNTFDTRFIKKYKLSSISSKSYIINKNETEERVKGQLRVRLLLKQKGGYYTHKNYTKLDKYYVGFIGLIKPIENNIVRWLKEPHKDFVPAGKTVRTYLQTENDRYFTGYTIF